MCDNNHGAVASHRVTLTDGKLIKARNLCGGCALVVENRWRNRPRIAGEQLSIEPIETWKELIVC